jgi:hypothetical protein
MDEPRTTRLIEMVLRCYPARWRQRHGDEAAELAALLIGDGASAASIAWSYLAGAAREWLTPRPGRPLSTVACALLVAACSLGVSAGLLASAAPARAASTGRPGASAPGQTASPAPASPAPASPAPAPAPGAPAPGRGVVPAAGHPQVFTQEAGHARPR